jgi:histidinol-phosphate/aromatic aminotransferase/cobyric acid decarboxylase-like protein/GNAT superfamily N-acetyltransferase
MKTSTQTSAKPIHTDPRLEETLWVATATGKDREKIYQFRHDIYACELGQHPTNDERILRDPLDMGNVYLVVKSCGELAGFVSITLPTQSSYSIDKYFCRQDLPFAIDDALFEIRLLTVLKPHRGRETASLLMYAAFRWIESHGGKSVVAIGRREILNLYLRAGLKRAGRSTRCGLVSYDLLYATVQEIREQVQSFSGLLVRLRERTRWDLNFPFSQPAGCFHGGAFFSAIGESFDDLTRREQIINADVLDAWFPPSPRVLDALQEHLAWLLKTSPPTACEGLIDTIANVRGVKSENILPGAGSSDLIFRAFRQWLSPNSQTLILDPTYGEYAHVLENVIGCTVDRMELCAMQNYDVPLDRLEAALHDGYDLVILVNPNSPTGRHIPKAALEAVLCGAPERTRIWVDETYVEYAGAAASLERFAAQSENVLVCKSMSKVYALSGARVGYVCAGTHQLADLRAVTPPWVVGLLAQVAGVNALLDPAYYAARYAETSLLRKNLADGLRECGYWVVPGVANFLMCHLPESGPSADWLVRECREHGLFLRNASRMGSQVGDRAIRVAVKDRASIRQILRTLQKVHNICSSGI